MSVGQTQKFKKKKGKTVRQVADELCKEAETKIEEEEDLIEKKFRTAKDIAIERTGGDIPILAAVIDGETVVDLDNYIIEDNEEHNIVFIAALKGGACACSNPISSTEKRFEGRKNKDIDMLERLIDLKSLLTSCRECKEEFEKNGDQLPNILFFLDSIVKQVKSELLAINEKITTNVCIELM